MENEHLLEAFKAHADAGRVLGLKARGATHKAIAEDVGRPLRWVWKVLYLHGVTNDSDDVVRKNNSAAGMRLVTRHEIVLNAE